ncbi:MAG TPA: hypothetical protein VN578_16070 [Candidatus Binatia bacterium]|jgi:hypothetical protein|nr:hypothetical protein [Candidatus Binatia bacterium]
MSSDYDATEFIDGDFEAHRSPRSATAGSANAPLRAPSREEVDAKVAEAQQKLSDLKRAQEELERERSGLEEIRRRQMEFQTGRQEMLQNLTRGLGLLEEAEFSARRDAEQMAKALADLRDALGKIEAAQDESWTRDNFNVELTRALTTLENARMEWNAARLKFPVLSGQLQPSGATAPGPGAPPPSLFATYSFGELCRLGFALTWPVAVALLGLAGLLVALLRK